MKTRRLKTAFKSPRKGEIIMDKKCMFVFETTDYDKFKTLGGNRFVDHSDKIVESINEVGQLNSPIIVNENFEIIDGQNRFEAYRKLRLPVHYIISPGYGIKECIAMNSVSKNWSTSDYIKSYANLGNEHYKYLRDMLGKYSKRLPNTVILAICSGNIDFYNKTAIRNGLFKIGDRGPVFYDEMLEFLCRFNMQGIKGNSDRLYKVIAYCYMADEISNEKLVSFFEKYSYQIESVVDTKQAVEAIEKVYNFKCNKTNYVFIASMYAKYAFEINAMNLAKGYKKGV